MADAGSRADGLLALVAAGDLTSFETLYDAHSPVLYALMLRMLGNSDDAQEVLQETFVQVWNRAAMYDASRGSEIAWLVSIARSRAIDRLRSRRLRADREEEAGREMPPPVVAASSVTDGAMLNEQSRAVRQALLELPVAQRSALELAYFDGLSQSEIAARLNEPLGTVKTRMQLGMKKLRERLREAYGR